MISFKVKVDGEDEYQVTADSRDILQWEKTTKGATFNDLATGLKMADMYKICQIASRRLGLYTGTLPEFEAGAVIDVIDDGEEPDPTQPAP